MAGRCGATSGGGSSSAPPPGWVTSAAWSCAMIAHDLSRVLSHRLLHDRLTEGFEIACSHVGRNDYCWLLHAVTIHGTTGRNPHGGCKKTAQISYGASHTSRPFDRKQRISRPGSRHWGFRGMGTTLLMDALYRTLHHSREVASAGVIVDAKDA